MNVVSAFSEPAAKCEWTPGDALPGRSPISRFVGDERIESTKYGRLGRALGRLFRRQST